MTSEIPTQQEIIDGLTEENERLRELIGELDLEALHSYSTCSEYGDNADRGCVVCQIIQALQGGEDA